MKKNILFLCTGNSCRSQMAEAWARHFWGHQFDIYSAGTKKHGMNPFAVKVMSEVEIDLTGHFSKTTEELPNIFFEFILTVCGHAHEHCPYFEGGRVIHVGFDDPPALTKDLKCEEEILGVYRRVRDEIKLMAIDLPNVLGL